MLKTRSSKGYCNSWDQMPRELGTSQEWTQGPLDFQESFDSHSPITPRLLPGIAVTLSPRGQVLAIYHTKILLDFTPNQITPNLVFVN